MGAELVIAVDISSPPDGAPTGDLFKMLLQTFSIMGKSINQFELREADIVLRPQLQGVGSTTLPLAAAPSWWAARPRWRHCPACARASPP